MKIKPSIAISDNGFLFDPGSGESYTTNAVAKEIIFMMKQNLSVEEIKKRWLKSMTWMKSRWKKSDRFLCHAASL